jgi:hypothetical protein
MSQYCNFQPFHVHDLDQLKTTQPHAKMISVQHLKVYKQKSNIDVA